MKSLIKLSAIACFVLALGSCQKESRPAMADFPPDTNIPGGPLKFYAAFDGTTTDPSMNAVDSIRANFAGSNPLTSVPGISGMAVQGVDGKAVNYPSANDFKNATSFTVAFWVKRALNNNTEFLFGLKDDTYGWSHSALFLMVEHGTATEVTFKFGVMDQWMEFTDAAKLQKPLLDGNWHHLAITYDENTSKMGYYFDGEVVTNVPASAVDVKNGASPRGKLDLSKTTNLVIGGWNRHAGLDGPTDSWVGSFGGSIDQFRMYSSVLTGGEVMELFNQKK